MNAPGSTKSIVNPMLTPVALCFIGLMAIACGVLAFYDAARQPVFPTVAMAMGFFALFLSIGYSIGIGRYLLTRIEVLEKQVSDLESRAAGQRPGVN